MLVTPLLVAGAGRGEEERGVCEVGASPVRSRWVLLPAESLPQPPAHRIPARSGLQGGAGGSGISKSLRMFTERMACLSSG